MKSADADVLRKAVNAEAAHHETARAWLDRSLSGDATVAFAWVALLAFVRLSTKMGLFPSPLSIDAAFDRVDSWISAAPAAVVFGETVAGHGWSRGPSAPNRDALGRLLPIRRT